MDDRFQIGSGPALPRSGTKNFTRQQRANNLSLLIKNNVLKSIANLLLDGWEREGRMTCRVAIDDDDVLPRRKRSCDGGLSGADTSCQYNNRDERGV